MANIITTTVDNADAGNGDYTEMLADIKSRVRSSQVRASVAINSALVLLYWGIGSDILRRQHEQGWGAAVIARLSRDLIREFPDMRGFSPRNLKYMRSFANAWQDAQIVQGPLAQLTWYHNIALLEKLADADERLWYARAASEYGWSRNVLVIQIERGLIQRQGKSITNFSNTLPPPRSDLASELLKDPYNFEFLTLRPAALEREIETGLLANIQRFLLELGAGFAFIGSQYRIEVDNTDFYIDLLFYHLALRCYIVIDLKAGEFKPEFAGKMNFYLAAVDEILRHPDDAPSIGLILCKERSRIIAEYALRTMSAPIGVSEFLITEALPDRLQGSLPTTEQLEHALSDPESSQ